MSEYDDVPPEDPYSTPVQTVDPGVLLERQVVGTALRFPRSAKDLQRELSGSDFHDLRLGRIFDGIVTDAAAGEEVDYLTVWGKLGSWDVRGIDLPELSAWSDAAMSPSLGVAHAVSVRKASMRRALAGVGETLRDVAADPAVVAAQVIEQVTKIRDAAATGGASARWLQDVLDVPEEEDAYSWVIPDLLERQDRLMLSAAEGSGKALALDTCIATPSGWTTMGEIEVGDEVFGADGKPTRVVATTDVLHGRDCFRVEFSDGSAIIADAAHQWVTDDYRSRTAAARKRDRPLRPHGRDQSRMAMKPAIRTTAEISETLHARDGFCLNHSIDAPLPLSLPDVDLPIDPYVLGAWLGDGTTRSAGMTLHDDDAEIFDHFREAGYTVERKAQPYRWWVSRKEARADAISRAGELIAAGMSTRAAERAVGLPRSAAASFAAAHPVRGWRIEKPAPAPRIQSFMEDLRAAGVLGVKHVPAAYKRASFAQRLAIVQGLMDTDGTVSGRGHERGRGAGASRCEFSVMDERLARDVHELILSLGIVAAMRESDATIDGRVVGRRWRIGFQTELPVFRLTRKLERIGKLHTRRSRHRFITAVAPIESVPVRCIQVENAERMYLAGRTMIPTHNSTLLRQIAILAAAGIHPFAFSQIDPVNVLVVDAENSERQWRRAARGLTETATIRGRRDPRQHLALHCVPVMDITRPNGLNQVHRWIDEVKPDLLLLGPLYRVAGGSSLNTDEDVAPLLAALDSIRDRGVAMLLEVHAGHARSTSGERELRPRGSSALLGWPEFGLGLRRDKKVEGRTPTFSLVRWRGDRDRRDWPARLVRGQVWPWEVSF